jgi:group II intron reverse transcriptase/maturase
MSDILKKASSPKILNRAWRKHRNDRAVWRIGMPREDMEPHLAYHLLQLSEDLRRGVYQPEPVRFFPVNKGDGGQRIISAVTLRDKVAQRAVLSVLEPLGEAVFHANSFGYRPKRNIEMALSKCAEFMKCGMEWVIDADIQSYFDMIPHGPLIKQVKSLVRDPKIVQLIKKWLDVGTPSRGFLSQARGIPQGSVLSPFLCNLYLTEFDNALTANNMPFVRFADDFLVFAKTHKNAETGLAFVDKTLKKLDLNLNPEKTGIALAGPNVQFLGKRLPRIRRHKANDPERKGVAR